MLEMLERIQDLRLIPDCLPGAYCIVPDEACEDERDRELDRMEPRSPPDDDEERRDEGAVTARHAARTEETFMPCTALDAFRKYLEKLCGKTDDERDHEDVGVDEVGRREWKIEN